jgi:hypothetical protein
VPLVDWPKPAADEINKIIDPVATPAVKTMIE